jgi:hypothetical protein
MTTDGKKDWHDVVVECEGILGCKDTAESPLMSNLPNLVRDIKTLHTVSTGSISKAREILQDLVYHSGWIQVGEYGECVFCGASEGDAMAHSWHRAGCLVLRAKELAAALVLEEGGYNESVKNTETE